MSPISKFLILILLFSPLLFSCKELSKQEKFEIIISSDEYYIREHYFGGIAGRIVSMYKVKTGEYPMMIREEGTDYQTYIDLERSNKIIALMDTFLITVIRSDDPDKHVYGGCMFHDAKYDFINSRYSIELKPELKSVRAFDKLRKEFY